MAFPETTPYIFTSERLGFRQWKQSDVEPFSEMNADAEVMEFFQRTKPTKESIDFIHKMNAFFQENNYCFYAVDELASNSFIGFIGLYESTFEANFTPCTQIGWRLRKQYWNKGFATEGALRCLEYGFSDLNLINIYSYTAILNKRSEKVMQKIGMSKIEEFDHPNIKQSDPLCTHILYKIEKGRNIIS